MKFVRIVLAVVLTAALLYVARTNSRGRPEHYIQQNGEFTLEMTTISKAYEADTVRFVVNVDGPFTQGIRPVIRKTKFGQDATTPIHKYDSVPLALADSMTSRYEHFTRSGQMGDRLYYYFQVIDATGGVRATFTREDGEPFVLKYVGKVPGWILNGHILLIFLTVFFVVLGSVRGIDLLRWGTDVHSMEVAYFWAVVCAFIGGYPFGFAMNWFTFGVVWEGVPFGTDATDNKTQILFVYLLLVMFSGLGSLTRGKFGRDVFSARTLGGLGLLGFFVMLGIYLIPHSIQFEPVLTKLVCWAFIGLMFLIYIYGLVTSSKSTAQPKTRGKK